MPTPSEIEQAFNEVLIRYRGSEKTPLAVLYDYLEELRQNGWQDNELEELERLVRQSVNC